MSVRSTRIFQPSLDRLEGKLLLTAKSTGVHPAAVRSATSIVTASDVVPKPNYGYLLYRITNPTIYNNQLIPPFAAHVRIGGLTPVAGQTYNILQIAVRNGTSQTFDANSNFYVRYPGSQAVPILTGTQQWKPGQEFIFYVLSHKYYPLPSQVHSGYEFSLQGARSIGLPGPSGIFLRVKYNPATFDHTLDQIVAYGPGNQYGKGAKFGLPNTSIYEFVSSRTNRNDFSGYF